MKRPWRYRALGAAYNLSFLAWMGGLFVAGFGQRIGAYILLGGFTVHGAIHWIFAVAGSREAGMRMWPEFGPFSNRVLEWIYAAAFVVLGSGILVGIIGERFAVYPLLVGLIGKVALDLIVGGAGYRAAMRRPWPAVAPLDDDDDW